MTSSKDFLRSRLYAYEHENRRNRQQSIAKVKVAEGREKSTSSFATEEEQVSVVEYTEDKLEASKYFH